MIMQQEWLEQSKVLRRGGNLSDTSVHEMEKLMLKFHEQLQALEDCELYGNKKLQRDRDRFVEKWQQLWTAMASEKMQLKEDTDD